MDSGREMHDAGTPLRLEPMRCVTRLPPSATAGGDGERPWLLEVPGGSDGDGGEGPMSEMEEMLGEAEAVYDHLDALAGPPVMTTGNGCVCCERPDHDRLFVAYCRSEMTGVDVAEVIGCTDRMWRLHLHDHVPNYEALREALQVGGGAEIAGIIKELRAEALRATDKFEYITNLRESLLFMKATRAALTSRGWPTDPQRAAQVGVLSTRIGDSAKELRSAEHEAAEWAAKMRREQQGSGWEQLAAVWEELSELLKAHPDVWAELLDRFRGRFGEKARMPVGGDAR